MTEGKGIRQKQIHGSSKPVNYPKRMSYSVEIDSSAVARRTSYPFFETLPNGKEIYGVIINNALIGGIFLNVKGKVVGKRNQGRLVVDVEIIEAEEEKSELREYLLNNSRGRYTKVNFLGDR